MSRIKAGNTKPELLLRSVLHKRGYRFRLNGAVSRKINPKGVLPGKPDLVFTKYRVAVFVHGCFWHRHKNCKRASIPKTRKDYWKNKFSSNIERDRRVQKELRQMGWKPVEVWEYQIVKDTEKYDDEIVKRLCSSE